MKLLMLHFVYCFEISFNKCIANVSLKCKSELIFRVLNLRCLAVL